MGLLKKVAKSVSKTVKGIAKNPIKAVATAVAPGIAGSALLGKSVFDTAKKNPLEAAAYGLNPVLGFQADQLGLLKGKDTPNAPKVNQDARDIQAAQQQYAQDFRAQLPGMKNQMSTQLQSDAQSQLKDDLAAGRSSASSRGLLYGGIQQGNEGKQRQQAQRGLIGGISNMNMGLDDAANQMDSAAAQTGINMQQQQQAMQNTIYQNAMAQMNSQNQIFGSVASSAGLLAMMSDERAKTNVTDCQSDISQMLDDLKSVEFAYKEFVNIPGMHYGVMAQDLEKSDAGKSIVFEQNGFKMIDVAKASGLILASLANIHHRLKKIEGENGVS